MDDTTAPKARGSPDVSAQPGAAPSGGQNRHRRTRASSRRSSPPPLTRPRRSRRWRTSTAPISQKRRTRATVATREGAGAAGAAASMRRSDTCPRLEDAAADFIDPAKRRGNSRGRPAGRKRHRRRAYLGRRGHPQDAARASHAAGGTCAVSRRRTGGLPSTRLYYDFYRVRSRSSPSHRVLAINRGEKEGFLSVTVLLDRGDAGAGRCCAAPSVKPGIRRDGVHAGSACEDAYDRLIYPSLEREVRGALDRDAPTDGRHRESSRLNLKPLLMQPPVKGHVTMGLDPGYAATAARSPWWTAPARCWTPRSSTPPRRSARKGGGNHAPVRADPTNTALTHIAIGNGTASRETEHDGRGDDPASWTGAVSYMMVNEAGASVYSASQAGGGGVPQIMT